MPMTTMLSTVRSPRVPQSADCVVSDRLWTVDCGRILSTATNLFDDFVRRQVAFPAVESARAEFAAVGAADLRGDAERVAVARLAVERGIGGNQNAFDERMVVQPPEKFLRGVVRALLADEFNDCAAKTFPRNFSRNGLGRLVIASQVVARRA